MSAVSRAVPFADNLRQTRWLLAGAWILVALALFWRAGSYPAVMTGDELWFAESAYHLLQDGVPSRQLHSDLVGSAVADFLPPVTALVQAMAFLLFGLTPFAVAAQSVIVPLAAMGLVAAAARRFGAPLLWAALAGLGLAGSQLFLRAGLYIRYDGLAVVFFLVYVWAGRVALAAPAAPRWHVLRGFALALAGLSYYPTAPFLGAAALVFEYAERRSFGWAGRTAALGGFAVPAIGFALYVASYPSVFAAQILSNGADNYLAFDLLLRPFAPHLWAQGRETFPEMLALILFFVLGGRWLRSFAPSERALYWAALVTALPSLIYPFQPRLLAMPMALALILLAVAAGNRAAWVRGAGRTALAAAGAAALATAALLAVTMVVQGQSRDYEPVAARLDALLWRPGAAGIDQRAWLALRSRQPQRELHHVMPAWAPGQVRIFESRLLRDPQGWRQLRYLVLNAGDAPETIQSSPALARGFAENHFVLLERIQPAFRPLPWAPNPPYDLLVYARRE